jgi:hypothetical protein
VTHALNHNVVRQDAVKDEVGIRKNSDPSKATLANSASRMRMRRDELDHGMDAALDGTSAQRRMIIDVGENFL